MPKDWSDNILLADLADEPELSDELAAAYQRIATAADADIQNVVLNFAGVTYLNSSNIAQILRLRKRITEHNKQLVLCAITDPVWSTMLLTGLDKVFNFAPDTASGIASVQLNTPNP